MTPPGQYYETSYEQLVEQPLQEMQAIYQTLGLPDFHTVKPSLCRYLANIADYQPNRYLDIPDELQESIRNEWKFVFDEWGYPRMPNAPDANGPAE